MKFFILDDMVIYGDVILKPTRSGSTEVWSSGIKHVSKSSFEDVKAAFERYT